MQDGKRNIEDGSSRIPAQLSSLNCSFLLMVSLFEVSGNSHLGYKCGERWKKKSRFIF